VSAAGDPADNDEVDAGISERDEDELRVKLRLGQRP
jgi:hypothetical protein